MKLLIDLGNTRLKLARWAGGQLHALEPVAHAAPEWRAQLRKRLASVTEPEEIWLADVARAELSTAVVAECAQAFPRAAIRRPTSPVEACGVRNAYAEPARLGIDRFLALVGAHRMSPEPKLVASLGTALAIDALHPDGRHRGGLIAPAPALMRDALLGATGRVHLLRPGRIADFGASTEDGVESGCWLACAALIERTARSFEAECSRAPLIVLGGGQAAEIGGLLEWPAEVVPDLVLQGLAQLCES
jgi:type III pantothenate kinase